MSQFTCFFTRRGVSGGKIGRRGLLSLDFKGVVHGGVSSYSKLLPTAFRACRVMRPNGVVFHFASLRGSRGDLEINLIGRRKVVASTCAYMRKGGRALPGFTFCVLRSCSVGGIFCGLNKKVHRSLGCEAVGSVGIIFPPVSRRGRVTMCLSRGYTGVSTVLRGVGARMRHLGRLGHSLVGRMMANRQTVRARSHSWGCVKL